ncbi:MULTISPECIES: helix-hairpin-helix domain-containing protein [Haloferax]|uniref:helix-hairpin-helix domain-containing protein n=1 Tax=Haloferax TaxID=2251 RepID=UPI000B7F43A8|nr:MULTISPECIES: helix-hairpin-helix domain-containing protein [Haloferax]MDS0239953.1 helix-hairpin-helix domain-containing protein [Haloferax sp. S2CR25]MDS0443074.1 helix-hairpin-helix domain-containing protein [Haloferax sp. S2CR25-2]
MNDAGRYDEDDAGGDGGEAVSDAHRSDEEGTDRANGPDEGPSDPDEALTHLLRPRGDRASDGVPTELQDLKYVGPATAECLAGANIDAAAIVDGEVCYRDLVAAGTNPGVAAKIRRWHSLSWSFNSGDDLDRRSSQVRGLGDDERAWVAASSGDWDETDGAADTDDGDSNGEAGDWTPSGRGEAAGKNRPARDGDWTPSGSGDGGDGADVHSEPTASGDWTPTGTTGASADGSGDALAAEEAWRERSKPEPLTTLAGIGEDDAELLAEAGVRSVRRLATADPEHVADALQIDPTVVSAWKAQARDAME